ncbi:MAG TPA: hypothetical protein VM369_01160 [Candidatus Binatia bacterium]|nr:hypothetical protein [Candidatus Binatia bacterium]
MTRRRSPDPAERSRLLDAAAALAGTTAWHDVTASRIVRAAKVAATRFRVHFRDVGTWLAAAQQRFMDGIRDRIVARTGTLPPGFERLRAASEIYLDGCLAQNELRRWLIEARGALPGLADGLERQNQVYVMVMTPEFARLGWPHPAAAAQLYLAMLMEAGVVESTAGRAVADVRETLWDFLRIQQ